MSVFNSGNWLMTAKRRAKEGILQAVGAHQATEDIEFDEKLRKFTIHVNELNRIKEAMDLWIDSYDTFCLSSSMLSESFKTFFSQSPFNSEDVSNNSPPSVYMNAAIAFDKVVCDMNTIIHPSVRETFVNRCLKPIISILSLVPAINEQVQERKTVMLDFDSYKAKIQKEHAAGRDSAHPNVIRKAQKLDDSAKKLYSIQQNIESSIDEFVSARPIMLGAEFTSFVACMYHQAYYTTDITAKLLPILPQTASSLTLMDSFVLQKQKTTVGSDFLPQTSFESTEFIRILKESESFVPVDAVLTRSEYLGGAYGGYSTGGPLQTLHRYGGGGVTDDEDDEVGELKVAAAHILGPSNGSTGVDSLDIPQFVDAVVIPSHSADSTAGNSEDSEEWHGIASSQSSFVQAVGGDTARSLEECRAMNSNDIKADNYEQRLKQQWRPPSLTTLPPRSFNLKYNDIECESSITSGKSQADSTPDSARAFDSDSIYSQKSSSASTAWSTNVSVKLDSNNKMIPPPKPPRSSAKLTRCGTGDSAMMSEVVAVVHLPSTDNDSATTVEESSTAVSDNNTSTESTFTDNTPTTAPVLTNADDNDVDSGDDSDDEFVGINGTSSNRDNRHCEGENIDAVAVDIANNTTSLSCSVMPHNDNTTSNTDDGVDVVLNGSTEQLQPQQQQTTSSTLLEEYPFEQQRNNDNNNNDYGTKNDNDIDGNNADSDVVIAPASIADAADADNSVAVSSVRSPALHDVESV